MRDIIAGSRIPAIQLSFLDDHDQLHTVSSQKLLAYGRAIILGVPGAFTPVCSKEHVPDFIQNADKLIASGFSHLICIAPNDPFVLQAWARQLDPGKKLEFLSDGNLDFARALNLQTQSRALFMGYCSERYLMIVEDGIIVRLRVEEDIISYTCTRTDDALDDRSVI